MARLRYNGLTATLGADLLTAGTTITFASKLTAADGDVPTITGTDYIPLAVVSDDGSMVLEIMHLTAYTSGATTGTVLRAQESTTATDHGAGLRVVHGLTVADTAEFASGGGGGGGDLTLISAQILAAATATVDFTTIPGTYRDLVIEAKIRSNRASNVNDNVVVTVGSGALDTGATNYRSHMTTYTNVTGVVDLNSTGRANFFAVNLGCPAATADADVWGDFRMTILDYADTSQWRVMEASSASHSTSAAMYRDQATGHWKNKTSAIDTLRIAAGSGQFIIGSTFRLYGRG